MSASVPRTPALRRHRPSAQAVVTLNGKDHYLGAWPADKRKAPPAVRDAYDRLIAEWLANGRRLPSPEDERPAVTVNEVLLAFWAGRSSTTAARTARRRTSWASTVTPPPPPRAVRADAGRRHLPAEAEGRPPAHDRRRLESRPHQPPAPPGSSTCSSGPFPRNWPRKAYGAPDHGPRPGTRPNRGPGDGPNPSGARRRRGGRPAVRAAARSRPDPTACLTGARPGEVCAMRGCDIDMTGDVWLYRPAHHKTRHKGKERVIALGPQAQAVVKPFLKLDTQAYLFSPRDGLAEVRAEKRRKRQTKVQPSQQYRRKARPKKQPRDHYTTIAYDHAIYAACDRAFPPTAPLARRPEETNKAWLARLSPAERDELALEKGTPLAPPPAAARARHRGPAAVRPGSRPGRAGSLPGERDAGVRRARPGPGNEGSGGDRLRRTIPRASGRE